MIPAIPRRRRTVLIASKRILAILHERSSLVPVLREAGVNSLITFSDAGATMPLADQRTMWQLMLTQLDGPPAFNGVVMDRFSAREMTRRQCAVFDRVVASHETAPPANLS